MAALECDPQGYPLLPAGTEWVRLAHGPTMHIGRHGSRLIRCGADAEPLWANLPRTGRLCGRCTRYMFGRTVQLFDAAAPKPPPQPQRVAPVVKPAPAHVVFPDPLVAVLAAYARSQGIGVAR